MLKVSVMIVIVLLSVQLGLGLIRLNISPWIYHLSHQVKSQQMHFVLEYTLTTAKHANEYGLQFNTPEAHIV